MSATTLHADLFSLTIDHAQHLGRDSVRRVGTAAKVARFFRFALSPADFACRFIDRLTLKMTDQSVWFQGVRASIDDGHPLQESDGVTKDDLIAELEKAQQVLVGLRGTLLGLEADFTRISAQSRIAASVRRLIVATTVAFDAVEGARWSIMERQADEDIAAGQLSEVFGSADALFASLRE